MLQLGELGRCVGTLGLGFWARGRIAPVQGNLIEIPFCKVGGGTILHISKGKLFLLDCKLLGPDVRYSWSGCQIIHLSTLILL